MRKLITTILLIVGVVAGIDAQDAHYSQYQLAPVYLNPALTGDANAKQRVGVSYRSQWAAIQAPYTTYGAFFDKNSNEKRSWGLLINQNSAGDASLKTTNILLSMAYKKQLARDNNFLSIGGQVGIGQKRFDPTAFTFDNQYSAANGFDATTATGEAFNRTSSVVPDLNIGAMWQFTLAGNTGGHVGLAFSHLLEPIASFYNDSSAVYGRKITANAQFNLQVSEKLRLSPRLLWMKEETAKEVFLGVGGKYKFNQTVNLLFGVDLRTRDAFVAQVGIDYKSLTVGVAYDVNSSGLSNFTNGNGSIELMGIYRFGKTKRKAKFADRDNDGIQDKDDKCPDVAGLAAFNGCPSAIDSDGDGIVDSKDKCPTVAGLITLSGCPEGSENIDSDGDGILDKDDDCPTVPGIPLYKGCPQQNQPLIDTDGDGIIDSKDKCPTVPGIPALNGCPQQNQPLVDSDGDGILDKDDNCPTVPGIPALSGCPPLDSDGDGILDKDDICPTVPGVPALKGCPEQNAPLLDTDGDGILDKDDVCPTVPGIVSLRGCPQNNQLKDSDGDGILDHIDLCPYIPGTLDYKGCNDTDKDGVWDNEDVCPKIFGEKANNGCPIKNMNADSDGDGVLDKDDKCIYLRGLAKHNGCPDSDNDGVSDIKDDCPFVKGSAINNGCPEKTTEPTTPTANSLREISIDIVEFDFDKSFIRPRYFDMLDDLVRLVKANPNYQIVLSSHTDFEGNDTYNYQLSQKRSQAVNSYLVKRGVFPSQIETRSYGETKPKSRNDSEEGKQRNRRTEIILLGY